MILVGSGALLIRAVKYVLSNDLRVDLVCCPKDDPSLVYLANRRVRAIQTDNPNSDLRDMLSVATDRTAFSINNSHILNDGLIDAGVSFFNIHAGLVPGYRGLAEICIFAALCRSEPVYGVTLTRLLPGDKVDAGHVVAQLSFPIREADGFADVLS